MNFSFPNTELFKKGDKKKEAKVSIFHCLKCYLCLSVLVSVCLSSLSSLLLFIEAVFPEAQDDLRFAVNDKGEFLNFLSSCFLFLNTGNCI